MRVQVGFNTEKSISAAIINSSPEDDYFVTEAAIGKKGDMDGMAKVIRPDVAIVTLIALEHFSAFKTREAIAEEKGKLVQALSANGIAFLNADDDLVMAMAARTEARIVTFGREREADYRVVSVESRFPDPLKITIAWGDNVADIALPLVGEHFWVSVAAAFAAAAELGGEPETIARQLSGIAPLSQRCEPVRTSGGPIFLVDTVKAPWHSLPLVLQTMKSVSAPRKRIVLGQLSDMTNARAKYRDAYRAAREVCDQVIFVGEHSHRSKASEEDRASHRFVEKTRVEDACAYIKETAIEGEVILLKSSPRLHLDRIALAWETEVRCWSDDCGLMTDCISCGLFDRPFSEHQGIPPRSKFKAAAAPVQE